MRGLKYLPSPRTMIRGTLEVAPFVQFVLAADHMCLYLLTEPTGREREAFPDHFDIPEDVSWH